MVHLLTQDYEGMVYDIEIFFDGHLVYREDYDPPMVVCHEYWYEEISFEGTAPKEIIIHFTDKNHENIGFVPSQGPQ